ncbi:MAG: patatin-like phospholipase family protein [Chloroflexota bacterium]|nr:patatin-like phospholipase family protein [Chloroflexota bacterium]
MKRALVLGGGGNVGIASETAVAAGLLDGGLDVRDADLIIGTSAGSVVGTHLAHGRDPRDLMNERRSPDARPLGGTAPDMSHLAAIFGLWASFGEMTQEHCAQVGRLALESKTMPEEQWLSGFEANAWDGWPAKPLWITAVDAESGAFKALDRDSGIEIHRAVAASCSVPGLFPPVSIDGRRYTDGGVRSGTSADLAQRIEPDLVLLIAPMGASPSGIGRLASNQIDAETAALEAAGAKVRAIRFDQAAKEASGANLMDPTHATPAAAAGEAHARRIAAELREWWGK